VKAPAITLRCDCGSEGRAAYGEKWTCQKCGRSYDTSQIPAGDYGEVAALDRRYKRVSWSIVAVLALLVLVAALTHQIIATFAGLAVVLLGWFLFIKPLVHHKHKKAVRNLTRSWELRAEGGPDA
jgi:ABC-type transport system involved in cytochrome bd biosynthesis fused ATPase/permease subunit